MVSIKPRAIQLRSRLEAAAVMCGVGLVRTSGYPPHMLRSAGVYLRLLGLRKFMSAAWARASGSTALCSVRVPEFRYSFTIRVPSSDYDAQLSADLGVAALRIMSRGIQHHFVTHVLQFSGQRDALAFAAALPYEVCD